MGVWKLSLPCSLCLVCLVFRGRGDFPLSQRLGYPRASVGGAYTSLPQLFFSLTCLVFWLRGYLLKLQVGDIAELQ